MGHYARIAVARPVQRTFHYRIPGRLRPWVRPGVRCVVPFGRTRVAGFVVALDEAAEVERVRDVLEILDPEPCLPPDLLSLGLWLASYYHHPPGETLTTMLPPAFRAVSEPVYRPGDAADTGFAPGSAEVRLMDRARSRGGVPAASLKADEYGTVAKLVEAGCLCRQWRVVPPPKLRGEEWCWLAREAPSPQALTRSPRLVQVLEALAGGPVPARVLRGMEIPRRALVRAVEKGWVVLREEAPAAADLSGMSLEPGGPRPELTSEQAQAVEAAARGLDAGEFAPLIVQGVTGSGKTEVYIQAVEEARKRRRGAVVLVPEISLTPQMLGRFLSAFQGEVAVLHSGLGRRERRLQWERLFRGDASVALGARSAIFAPVRRLGLIVVDEEHEASYKQEDGLRYNAKHAALVRARTCGAAVLLGSATPDVETFWAARSGRYGCVVLPRRVQGARPPEVRVVDLRQEERRRRGRVLLSEPLRRAVDEALTRREQALLFLNRRGFSPALVCTSCGEAVSCRRCSIALTLHRSGGKAALLCHYCGAGRAVAGLCPHCEKERLVPAGAGTQQLVEAAREAWDGARVVRLDRDAARRSGGAELLGAFHRGDADILVGTQMVAKGHHFPRLTVVGVVDADLSLHFPDFRAAERTFQVLNQVAGRAGRENLRGLAIFQTRNPHHPVITAAAAGDYEAFASAEVAIRREAGFPPFRRLGLLGVSSTAPDDGRRAAQAAAAEARRLGERLGVEVLGPAPAPVERIRGRWRFQVLLRAPGPEPGPLQNVIRRLMAGPVGGSSGSVRIHVDVDPVSLL